MSKPLILTPRAARWLHALVHTQGLGVQVDDLAAANEAVTAIDAYVKKLGPPPGVSPEPPAAALNGAGK